MDFVLFICSPKRFQPCLLGISYLYLWIFVLTKKKTTNLMEYNDETYLLGRLRKDDEKAFEYVFHRYYKRLCLFATHFAYDSKEAEDIVEEAFVKIWKSKKNYESIDHLRASLYQAVRQIGINHQTSHTRRRNRVDTYLSEKEHSEDTLLHQIVHTEVMSALHAAIHELPPRARQIIIGTYLEGKSNQEVADELGLSIQTVKNQKIRALSILRTKLNPDSFRMFILGCFIFEKFQ